MLLGYDMAYIFNGYVYHTEYDRVTIISKQSLQNTGDNVLALAKGVANAPEMDNPEVRRWLFSLAKFYYFFNDRN